MALNLYDLINPAELTGFVQNLPLDESFPLRTILPANNINDIEYRVSTGRLTDIDAGVYRAFDTEAPIGKRQGVKRFRGEIPPLSKKMPLSEEEFLRKQLIDFGNSQGLIDQIYDDVRWLVRSLEARIEIARGQVIETGTVVINENGVQLSADFGRDGTLAATAGTPWSTVATATIVADLQAWIQIYKDLNNQQEPAYILTSRKVFNYMLRNAEFRTLLGSLAGTPGLITPASMESVLSAYGLPPVRIYDQKLSVNGTLTRPLSDNKVFLMPPDGLFGQTLYGVTREAQKQIGDDVITRDQGPGYATQVWETVDPVHLWSLVSAIALPAAGNPNLVFVGTVSA